MRISCTIIHCFISFLLLMSPVSADSEQTILISGEGLPYIMVASIQEDSMDLYLIPQQLSLPSVDDTSKALPLYIEDPQRLKKTIEHFYDLTITNTVCLHMDAIHKDMGDHGDEPVISDMSHMTAYFSNVVKNAQLSMLFHISDYVEADLNLQDYYHLYRMFHDEQSTIRYHYAASLYAGSQRYPLDNRFY